MNGQDFLKKMVDRCEVNTFQEMYYELVKQKNDVLKCSEAFPDNPKYTIEKIKKDILTVPNVIYIELFEFNPKKTIKNLNTNNHQVSFRKIPYLATISGFERIIKNYRDSKYLQKSCAIDTMIELWGIQQEEESKLIEFIKDCLKNNIINAFWDGDKSILQFNSLLEVPGKKKKLIQLIGAIILFIIILVVLLWLTKLI